MEDNLPPGFPPGYTLSGNTSHSKAYDLLVKKAAGLVRQEDAQRAGPPRLSTTTTTTAKCRTRKLRDATSLLRKGEAPSTPRRTRRATKTSAFPRRTPRAKTGKAENGTNLPASIDVPPQYEATQQTAAAIFLPQTSSATAIEGAPVIPPLPKNGKECNKGETELEENLSFLPRRESYRNTSHEFPSSCSHVTPAFSSPAVSTAESSPTGSPPAPSAATASPPEQAREAAATANSPGALSPPAPSTDVMATAKKGSKQLTQQAAQTQASGEAPPKKEPAPHSPKLCIGHPNY
ncbi:mucin-7-like [Rhipicephalus sanguineus]|uniref:mucin-7-like n=1 Tax=Rhipicephalus sanguineus TaxID=34632 RepID=UPI0018941F68|nr:mucin-7-like [Rhipicephalus sanguineus]